MGRIIIAAAAALTLASAPAFAKSQNDGEAGAAGKGKVERKICKSFENTASRMKREKLCLTRQQWKKFDAEQAAQ